MIDVTLLYIAICIFLLYPLYFIFHYISYDGETQCEIAQLIFST